MRDLPRLSDHLGDGIPLEALAPGLERVERRLRRRRHLRRGAVVSTTLALVAGGVAALVTTSAPNAPPPPLTYADGAPLTAHGSVSSTVDSLSAIESTARVVPLSDGSSIQLRDGARLRVVEHSSDRVAFALAGGSVRFDVRPGGGRRWSVRAGPLTVHVLGTSFTVTRAGDRASVFVHHGTVAVEAGQQTRRLYGGERFEVGATEETAVATLDDHERRDAREVEPAPEPIEADTISVRESTPQSTMAHSSSPQVERRLDALEPARVAPRSERRREPLAAMLSRADQARAEGRVDDAIESLTAIIDAYPTSSEAPAAAVAIARLEQGRDRLPEAANAYRRALRLRPPPALAELCYERWVRAELAMGQHARALEAAAEYRRAFPTGGRSAMIEALVRRP